MPAIARDRGLLLLRGSLTTFRRRCGKPSCRCADGDPHESPALTFTEGGRSRTVTLSAGEVAAALERYARARAELEADADAGIAALRARRAGRQGRRA
jgi:hypothetical protein